MSSNNTDTSRLTPFQGISMGLVAGVLSSLVNQPIHVLRARYQDRIAFREAVKSGRPPAIFTLNPRTLYKGLNATLASNCFLAVLQGVAKQQMLEDPNKGIPTKLFYSSMAGFASSVLATPFEGTIVRQHRTVAANNIRSMGTFAYIHSFFRRFGLAGLYRGYFCTAVRSSMIGSAFTVWAPMLSARMSTDAEPKLTRKIVSGILVGVFFGATSQPMETARIRQQYAAAEGESLGIRQTFFELYSRYGVRGLFEGGFYRIPRMTFTIFSNAMVYSRMEDYFHALTPPKGRW